jgi:hypothetical protein
MIITGKWHNDYKAGIAYLVKDVKVFNGKTIILCETHTAPNSPVIGFDVVFLERNGTIPVSEKWGERAWSYCTYEQAAAVFQKIL